MPLVPLPKNCDISVKRAIQGLSDKLGYTGTPNFKSITLTDLVASRLVATNSGKVFESVADLTAWIAGTANQITITDDGDGTLTLSTPQNIHVDATPEFAGLTIKNGSGNIVFHINDDEMYFTTGDIPIADGMPIGLLLALTYKT